MDTVYLALDVLKWKTPSELGTEQNYAPRYIVIISKCELYVLHWNVHIRVSNLEGGKQFHGQGGHG